MEDWLVDELGVWWEKDLVLSMVISLVIKLEGILVVPLESLMELWLVS